MENTKNIMYRQNDMSTYTKDLAVGSFVESVTKTIYEVRELSETSVYLQELDTVGNRKESFRRFPLDAFAGLIRNRHFSHSKVGRRLNFNDIEGPLEFNKLTPKSTSLDK